MRGAGGLTETCGLSCSEKRVHLIGRQLHASNMAGERETRGHRHQPLLVRHHCLKTADVRPDPPSGPEARAGNASPGHRPEMEQGVREGVGWWRGPATLLGATRNGRSGGKGTWSLGPSGEDGPSSP